MRTACRGTGTSAPRPARLARLDRAAGLSARKKALTEARARAAAILTADPSLADAVVGRQAGCAYGTVGRIRRQLTEAGTITDPGYRTGHDGKQYRVIDDPRRVTGRAVTIIRG